MARILIIGYGNPLRSDDGIGWHAAEELTRWFTSPEVEVLIRYQLTPEVADVIHQCDAVIFIDAGRDGVPGEVMFERITAKAERPSFSHELAPAAVLELCRQIYHRCPAAFMVSLCGECFEHGEGLSAKVAASLPHLTALVGQLANSEIAKARAA